MHNEISTTLRYTISYSCSAQYVPQELPCPSLGRELRVANVEGSPPVPTSFPPPVALSPAATTLQRRRPHLIILETKRRSTLRKAQRMIEVNVSCFKAAFPLRPHLVCRVGVDCGCLLYEVFLFPLLLASLSRISHTDFLILREMLSLYFLTQCFSTAGPFCILIDLLTSAWLLWVRPPYRRSVGLPVDKKTEICIIAGHVSAGIIVQGCYLYVSLLYFPYSFHGYVFVKVLYSQCHGVCVIV